MGKLDAIASDVGARFGASPDAARAAVCLVLRAHHGDGASRQKVTALAQTRAAPLLAGALRSLQAEPSFWVSHYVMRAHGSAAPARSSGTLYNTGDMFGDIANAASSAVQSVSNVVKDPGKALAKAASDITRDPLGTLGNVIQSALNAAVPLDLLKPIPGLGSLAQMAKSYSPLSTMGQLANSALHGDLGGVMKVAKGELTKLQSVASMVPGLGTGISTAIGAAEALLNGGKPLEIALRAAYGAIPIPPGIRDVCDTVLDAVIALANGGSVTDAALTIARDRVPDGFPRDVFDTLAQIIVRHEPIGQAAGELAMHEAAKAASGVGPALVKSLASAVPGNVSALLSKLPDPSKVFPGAPANLMGVSGLLSKLPADLQKKAAAAVIPLVKSMPSPPPRRPALTMHLPPKPAPPPRPALSMHLATLAPPKALPAAPGVNPSASMLTANAPFNMFAPYT